MFRLCIFESDTVKSDCPIQNFRNNDEIIERFNTDCYLLKKKSSEDDQSTGHFHRFFPVPLTLDLNFFSHKSTYKKF